VSAPLRFLIVAVVGWGAIRAADLGILPGASLFTTTPSAAAVPPIVPTQFAPIDPPAPSYAAALAGQTAPYGYPPYAYPPPSYAYAYPQPYYAPASYPAPRHSPAPADDAAATEPAPDLYPGSPPASSDWLLERFANASVPARRSSAPAFAPAPKPRGLDRLQFTTWALMRGQSNPSGLATGGTLGGSQAGARLTYNFNRRFAASLRTSAPLATSRGGEVAAGIKVTPSPSIPVSLTAERRQSIGKGCGGRSAFALFLEGGVYRRPMPWKFELDAYAQAGVVGLRHRDLFADGSFAFTRPVWGRYSAGFGIWGGAQPGLYRIDAGPRISMKVRDNIRVHLDYRQRIAGTAFPASGPALTLAGDF
jgi:hypothetical protein